MTPTKVLEQKIESAVEQLVRAHLATVEKAAVAAVLEGVRRATHPSPSRRENGKASRRRAPSSRRSPEELRALQERLYEAICAHPGETMTVLAPSAGATARELARPATLLRQAGRVRSVGQRHSTRYFPMGA